MPTGYILFNYISRHKVMSFSEVNVFFNDECNIITLFYYDIIKWLKYNFYRTILHDILYIIHFV